VKICCYAAVKRLELFKLLEFYRQDIRALRDLGHNVRLANRPSQLRGHDSLFWVWWPTSGAPAVAWAFVRRRGSILIGSISQRDETLSGLRAKPPLVRAAARASFMLADLTLAVSEDTRLGLKGLRVKRLAIAPHAVDTDFYRPNGEMTPETPYVLTISQLTEDNVERKRLLDVVRTAAEVRSLGSDLSFVIAGRPGSGTKAVEDEIKRHGLQDQVLLAGEVSAETKRRLLRGAAIYLQPTRHEAFGLAIAEAMSCGTPVVSNAVGAVPEVVGDAGTLLPPAAEAREIAEAVLNVLEACDHSATARARRRVVENFSYEIRRERIAEAIEYVSGKHRLPG
jgi:glycosyltransferase involved in cell wall biosynthesis